MCGEAQGCTHVCMRRRRCVCMREEAWGRAARWGVSSSLHPHPPDAQIWKARAPRVLPRSAFSSRKPVPLQLPCPRAPSCSDWGHTQPWLGSSPSPAQRPPSVTMGASISALVQGLAGSCRRCSPGCPAATCTCVHTHGFSCLIALLPLPLAPCRLQLCQPARGNLPFPDVFFLKRQSGFHHIFPW